jgi:hypothetical protein
MNKSAEQMIIELEEQRMLIKSMETDLRDLTRQNYELMKRISQLCDQLRQSGIGLNSFS